MCDTTYIFYRIRNLDGDTFCNASKQIELRRGTSLSSIVAFHFDDTIVLFSLIRFNCLLESNQLGGSSFFFIKSRPMVLRSFYEYIFFGSSKHFFR
jgi:hypothetical protein